MCNTQSKQHMAHLMWFVQFVNSMRWNKCRLWHLWILLYSPLAKIAFMLISGNFLEQREKYKSDGKTRSHQRFIMPPELQAADFNEEKGRKRQATRLLYYVHGGNTIVSQASVHDTIIIILLNIDQIPLIQGMFIGQIRSNPHLLPVGW